MMILPTTRRKRFLLLAWIILFCSYFWPGGVLFESVHFEVFGWPFFALWVVIIGPLLAAIIFYLNARFSIQQDIAAEQTGEVDQPTND